MAGSSADRTIGEVGITGGRGFLRYVQYLALVVLGALSLFIGNVASAHTLKDWRKERAHISHRARRELGVPYRYGGVTPHGFDCSGFTLWTFHNNGAELPHNAAAQFSLAHHGGFKRIWKRSHLKKADLVFFHTVGSGVGHAGIYLGHGRFISATSSSGIHIDSIYDPYYWGPRYVGAVRIPAARRYKAPRFQAGHYRASHVDSFAG